MFASIKQDVIQCISDNYFTLDGATTIKIDGDFKVGDRYQVNNKLKIAILSNFGTECGISQYCSYLFDALVKISPETIVLAEDLDGIASENIIPCWKRGQSLDAVLNEINKKNVNFLIINHEYGLFPDFHELTNFISRLTIPYLVICHSTYRHNDKLILQSTFSNILVHNELVKTVLIEEGIQSNIFVINHGCEPVEKIKVWPAFGKKVIGSFGHLFKYKGVEEVLYSLRDLLDKYPEHSDLRYMYFTSTQDTFRNIHNNYYAEIAALIDKLDLRKNVTIVRGHFSKEIIYKFLSMLKCAIFFYQKQDEFAVYGSSGATCNALNFCPVILSNSCYQFTEYKGKLPLVSSREELVNEIHEQLTDWKYTNILMKVQKQWILENSWDFVAHKVLSIIEKIKNGVN